LANLSRRAATARFRRSGDRGPYRLMTRAVSSQSAHFDLDVEVVRRNFVPSYDQKGILLIWWAGSPRYRGLLHRNPGRSASGRSAMFSNHRARTVGKVTHLGSLIHVSIRLDEDAPAQLNGRESEITVGMDRRGSCPSATAPLPACHRVSAGIMRPLLGEPCRDTHDRRRVPPARESQFHSTPDVSLCPVGQPRRPRRGRGTMRPRIRSRLRR